jgi:serine/threonine protein phosphatase 1
MSQRLFAVGDIHGCADELATLLGGLPLEQGDRVVFVGDYLDRGPDSRGVIDLLLEFRRTSGVDCTFLKGNHEDMCLAFLGRPGHWGESWLYNGGAAAIRSYGLDARSAPAAVEAAMPPEHIEFLEGLERAFSAEDWLVVHAGVRPELSWEEQDEQDLFWIREDFILRPHRLPHTIVFGHTPQRRVFVDLPYKIGIDTGCVYGGMLTALELASLALYQVTRGERRVRESSLTARSRQVG